MTDVMLSPASPILPLAERAAGYELLSELLEYPSPGVLELAQRCRMAITGRDETAVAEVSAFETYVAGIDERDLEELYARTFDLNPPASMDLGYQIFGESYKRGILLVKFKQSVEAHGVDRKSELPDHLPVVLRLLARLPEEESPRSLVEEIVLPTTVKILGTFSDQTHPYCGLLRAVVALLKADFGIETVNELPHEIELPWNSDPTFGSNGLPVDGKRHLDVLLPGVRG